MKPKLHRAYMNVVTPALIVALSLLNMHSQHHFRIFLGHPLATGYSILNKRSFSPGPVEYVLAIPCNTGRQNRHPRIGDASPEPLQGLLNSIPVSPLFFFISLDQSPSSLGGFGKCLAQIVQPRTTESISAYWGCFPRPLPMAIDTQVQCLRRFFSFLVKLAASVWALRYKSGPTRTAPLSPGS